MYDNFIIPVMAWEKALHWICQQLRGLAVTNVCIYRVGKSIKYGARNQKDIDWLIYDFVWPLQMILAQTVLQLIIQGVFMNLNKDLIIMVG